MPAKPAVAVLISPVLQPQVLDEPTRARINRRFAARWPKAQKVLPEEAAELLNGAEGCITCWGTPRLTAEVLAQTTTLRIAAHAAGSVKPVVSDAFWERGIVVTSAAAFIAVDVAQYAVGLMIVGCKNVFQSASYIATGKWGQPEGARRATELRGATVGIIAASHVGRNVLRLLKHFDVEALLHDPFCSPEQARKLGAEKVEVDDLFRRSDIVSVHAPSLPATHHIVNAARLALLKDGAILINTSRGSLVDEAALVAELRKNRLQAFLDVTDPEPPPPGSPLYGCPNLTLSPHIAGSSGRGRMKLTAQAVEELQRFFQGKPPQFPVTKEMLERIG